MTEKVLLDELPTRECEVYGLGKMNVVRHINRIDVLPTINKPRETHGWQVRYQGKSKYFGDAGGSPHESLKRAELYLQSIYKGRVAVLNDVERLDKRFKLDTPGVRVMTAKRAKYKLSNGERRDSGVMQIYVEAINPFRGARAQRFYVGTSNTVTEEKMMVCLQKAKNYRERIVNAYKAFRAQVPPWSPESTAENFMKFMQTTGNAAVPDKCV